MKRNTFIIVLLSIIAFYLLFLPIFIFVVPDVVLRGQIGDSFGVATSIVTALAFMGVIWSIRQSDKHHAEQLEKQQEVYWFKVNENFRRLN